MNQLLRCIVALNVLVHVVNMSYSNSLNAVGRAVGKERVVVWHSDNPESIKENPDLSKTGCVVVGALGGLVVGSVSGGIFEAGLCAYSWRSFDMEECLKLLGGGAAVGAWTGGGLGVIYFLFVRPVRRWWNDESLPKEQAPSHSQNSRRS